MNLILEDKFLNKILPTTNIFLEVKDGEDSLDHNCLKMVNLLTTKKFSINFQTLVSFLVYLSLLLQKNPIILNINKLNHK